MSDYAERLSAANQSLRFTNIRGKEYAEVNQRILAFWSLFPTGRIITDKTFDDGQRCEFKCYVFREEEDEKPTTTGHAYEVTQGNVNSTSYVENCETSAIGRALGLLGIGATTAIASADEVLNAIAQQEAAQSQPKPQNKRNGANTRPQQQAPATAQQNGAAARKETFAHIAKLKMQAMENGVKEEGINSWFEAKFGKVGMNRLTNAQLKEVTEYLETIVRDSADRHLLKANGEQGAEQDASKTEANGGAK